MKINKHIAAAVSACTINMMAVGAAQAQTQLEEIIVTAQKRAQNLQEVPVSVSVVSVEQLTRQNINTTVSLAQSVPSVSFQESFSPVATNFNIRGAAGFGFAGGIQPSVALVVDGVAFARAGEYISQLGDVERLEVLKGPQGTLFGRNATAGVINITTQRPSKEEWEGFIDTTFTDDEEELYRGRVSGPLSEKVGVSLTGYYQDREGFVDNVSPGVDDGNGVEGWGVRGQLDIDVTDNLNILLIGDYSKSTHGLGVGIVDVVDSNPFVAPLRVVAQGNGDAVLGQQVVDDNFTININDSDQFDAELELKGVSANVSWSINDNYQLVSITSYRESEQADNPDLDAGPGQVANGGFGLGFGLSDSNLKPGRDDSRSVLTNSKYFNQELRVEYSSDSLEWTAGVFYTDFEEAVDSNTELFFPFIPAVNGPAFSGFAIDSSDELKAFSAFADATFRLTETLSIYGGYRWSEEQLEVDIDLQSFFLPDGLGLFTLDAANNTIALAPGIVAGTIPVILSESTTTDDESFRLGLSWTPLENLNFYTTYSGSFVGTGVDLGINSTLVNGTAFVSPTRTKSFEVGAKMRLFDDSVQLNIAVFDQQVEDLQTSIGTFVGGAPANVLLSAGDVDIQGAELDFLWAVSDYVRLSASAAYTDAEIENLIQGCFPGQTFAGGCNLDAGGNPATGPALAVNQDLDGTDATNTPEFKYNIGVNVDVPLQDLPFDFYGSLNYVWQDEVNFSVFNDPLTTQDSYGVLDLTLGITDKEGRYDISVFGKNITDKNFVSDAIALDGFQGRRVVRLSRGAEAYYGLRLRYNF